MAREVLCCRAWSLGVAACCLALVLLAGAAVPAKEVGLSEEQGMIAMYQYLAPHCFGRNLEVGDWVKYSREREGEKPHEIELKVTGQEKGGVWIVEKSGLGLEIHALVSLKDGSVMQLWALDDKGNKKTAALLDEKTISAVVAQQEKQFANPALVGWTKGAAKVQLEVAGATYTCSYLEPQYNPENVKGVTEEQLAEIKKGSRMYFSDSVPRLIPTFDLAHGWLLYIDSFDSVTGGVVKCKHYMDFELTSHSGQKATE